MSDATNINSVIQQQLLTRLAYRVELNPSQSLGMEQLENYAAKEFEFEPEALAFFNKKIRDEYDLVGLRNEAIPGTVYN